MPREDLVDAGAPRRSQPDDAAAPVLVVEAAHHQAALLQAVDGGRDRAAREVDAPADVVDLLRPLVQQDLEDREVGETETRGLDALHRVSRERAVSLHEDEPEVNA